MFAVSFPHDTDPDSLANIPQWIELFRDNRGDRALSIICGNKSDLDMYILHPRRNFDKKKLEAIMEKHKLPYHAISAKTGDNIETLFYSVVDMIN